MATILKIMWKILTGEIIFYLPGKPANGGLIIAIRTGIISSIIFLLGIALESKLQTNSSWNFSCFELKKQVVDNLGWLGAIMAGVYAALYTRFADQFRYLAETYNQIAIIQMELNLQYEEWLLDNKFKSRDELITMLDTFESFQTLLKFKAGFIEDVDDLHLASKPMFKPAIRKWIDDPKIADYFIKYTEDGRKRLEQLRKASL